MEKEIVELSDEELGFQFKKFEDVKLDQSKVPEVAIDHPSSSTKSPPTEVRNGIYGENDTFRSTFPFFQRCLDQYGLKVLRIPLAFAEKYLSSVGTKMTLRNEEGKCWEVKFMPKGRRADRPRFCRGWVEFVRDNELKLGDLCVFELLNTMQIQAYILPIPSS